MRCHHCRELLDAYRHGALGDLEPSVERHLRNCPSCRAELADRDVMDTLAAGRVTDWTPPAGFARATREAVEVAERSAVDDALGRARRRALPRRTWRAWPGLLGLAGILLALPATREATWPTASVFALSAWSGTGEAAVGPLARLLRPGAVPDEQTAIALREPWAMAAFGEVVNTHDGEQWHWFERALDLAPQDEVTMLRRAELFVGAVAVTDYDPATQREPGGLNARQPGDKLMEYAERASAELVADHPDNAYGHYLRAALLLQRGDEAGCWAEVQAGNRAPRCFAGHAEAGRRLGRLYLAAGQPRLAAVVQGNLSLLLPALSRLRVVGRWAELRVQHQLAAGETADAARTMLTAARMGARLRDDAETVIEALVGMSIEQTVFASTGQPEYPAQQQPDKETQALDQAAMAAAWLADQGRTEEATWVRAECERSATLRRAIRSSTSAWVSARFDRAMVRLAGWQAVVWLLVGQALLLMLSGGLVGWWRRRGGKTALVWRRSDLAWVWALSVVPATLLAAVVGFLGTGHVLMPWHSAPRLELILIVAAALLLLPSAALAGSFWCLGGRYAVRHGLRRRSLGEWAEWLLEFRPPELPPLLDFVRRAWTGAALPTAALLLYLALACTLPAARQNHLTVAAAQRCFADEQALVRSSLPANAVPWPDGEPVTR